MKEAGGVSLHESTAFWELEKLSTAGHGLSERGQAVEARLAHCDGCGQHCHGLHRPLPGRCVFSRCAQLRQLCSQERELAAPKVQMRDEVG